MSKIIQIIPATGWSAFYEGNKDPETQYPKLNEEALLFWGLSDDGVISGMILTDKNCIDRADSSDFLGYFPKGDSTAAYTFYRQKHGLGDPYDVIVIGPADSNS